MAASANSGIDMERKILRCSRFFPRPPRRRLSPPRGALRLGGGLLLRGRGAPPQGAPAAFSASAFSYASKFSCNFHGRRTARALVGGAAQTLSSSAVDLPQAQSHRSLCVSGQRRPLRRPASKLRAEIAAVLSRAAPPPRGMRFQAADGRESHRKQRALPFQTSPPQELHLLIATEKLLAAAPTRISSSPPNVSSRPATGTEYRRSRMTSVSLFTLSNVQVDEQRRDRAAVDIPERHARRSASRAAGRRVLLPARRRAPAPAQCAAFQHRPGRSPYKFSFNSNSGSKSGVRQSTFILPTGTKFLFPSALVCGAQRLLAGRRRMHRGICVSLYLIVKQKIQGTFRSFLPYPKNAHFGGICPIGRSLRLGHAAARPPTARGCAAFPTCTARRPAHRTARSFLQSTLDNLCKACYAYFAKLP